MQGWDDNPTAIGFFFSTGVPWRPNKRCIGETAVANENDGEGMENFPGSGGVEPIREGLRSSHQLVGKGREVVNLFSCWVPNIHF